MSRSIVSNDKFCYFCGSYSWIEKHHIFGGPNRDKSEKYGLWVNLCHNCHNEPPNGVHHNKERMQTLRAIGQAKFNKAYPDLDFMQIFHKNYLE